jgi:transposase
MKKIIHYIGLDVHKNSIAVAIAVENGGELRSYGTVGGKLADLDKLIKKLEHPGVELRFCYEAGPTGYVICRHLKKRAYSCEVIAPSLIPQKPSDQVKTNRRDAKMLARLFRAGELTSVHVPDEEDEAVRDLERARFSAVKDQRRARQRLKGLLLRQGLPYEGKTSWGPAHLNYLARLKMPNVAQQIAFEEYKSAITVAGERLERLSKALEAQLDGWKWKPVVLALMTLRGIQTINAMTLLAELGDLSRFTNPQQLMSYLGRVSSEDSTGDKRRQGGITKAGNEAGRRALIEAAQHYRLPARLTPSIQARQHGQSQAVRAIAWKAQQRLHGRYHHLKAKGKKTQVVVTAIARELAGFVWAIACTALGKAPTPRASKPEAPALSANKSRQKKTYQLKPAVKYSASRKASRPAAPRS